MCGEDRMGLDRYGQLQVRLDTPLYVVCTDLRVSLYTNSISVALQALTVISMGDVADHRESGAS